MLDRPISSQAPLDDISTLSKAYLTG